MTDRSGKHVVQKNFSLDSNQGTSIDFEANNPVDDQSKILFCTSNPNASIEYDHSVDELKIRTFGDNTLKDRIILNNDGITFTGNVTVQGTHSTINSTDVSITDRIIILNKDEIGTSISPPGTSGIQISRGQSSTDAFWQYNDNAGKKWWEPSKTLDTSGTDQDFKTLGNIQQIDTSTAGQSLKIAGTGALILPTGTTGQQPTAVAGMIRYNTGTLTLPTTTVTGYFETRNATSWNPIITDIRDFGGLTRVVEDLNPQLGGDLDVSDGINSHKILNSQPNENIILQVSGSGQIKLQNFNQMGNTLIQALTGSTDGYDLNIQGGNGSDGKGGNVVFSGGEGTLRKGEIILDGNIKITDNSKFISNVIFESDILPYMDDSVSIGNDFTKFSSIYATDIYATSFHGTLADLAERYESHAVYEPGTVVVFGGDKEIITTTIYADTRVAGVISMEPGIRMNAIAGSDATHPYVALKGKVPCKIRGEVRKGDLIVTSKFPGYGQSAGRQAEPYTAFARALENFNGEAGVIMVCVF